MPSWEEYYSLTESHRGAASVAKLQQLYASAHYNLRKSLGSIATATAVLAWRLATGSLLLES
jgi:hypothetical protein